MDICLTVQESGSQSSIATVLKGVAALKEGCSLRGTMSPEGSKGVSTACGVVNRNGSDGMN